MEASYPVLENRASDTGTARLVPSRGPRDLQSLIQA
jgi:hypothetical protein